MKKDREQRAKHRHYKRSRNSKTHQPVVDVQISFYLFFSFNKRSLRDKYTSKLCIHTHLEMRRKTWSRQTHL